ncbi:carboxynorspermidine decarboxylase [Ekhidna sp. To15]|uniref:carboxynorspermidine decarboxylase n=1 Tax=Ekhidna sp. To15 TaxID=3395267 RepID=UPI003F525947
MKIPSPCFVLNESKLIQNLQLIDSVQKRAEIEIILAFKGFAMWSAFPNVKQYVKGATASSLNEVKLCNEEMEVKSHTYCVAYAADEFDDIVAQSSHITFNSLNQYHQFIDQVPENVSVGLRVNPEWSDVETDLYNPSSPVSRLGISSKDLARLPARVEGLHFHVLCESDSYALENVLNSFEKKFGHLLHQIHWVNMGGGHLMTREGYDTDHLVQLLSNFREKHDVHLILEPGSAFAWQTGDLHTTVLDIVDNGGKKTAIFDGSFTCHMPDCLEMPYRPKLAHGSDEKVEGWHAYRLGGVSCLAGDFLDDFWFEEPLKAGDSIVFKDMIHYTMVKTSTFNGVKHPSIGIIRKDGAFDLVREFGYKDFKNRLS